MALEADADFQILLFRFLGGGEDSADAGSIDGDRLFHENVFALLDGFFEVHRAEAGRRGEDDDVGQRDRLFVGVEADELVFFRHVDAVGLIALGHFFLSVLIRAVEAIAKDVGHGDEFDRPFGAQGLAAAPVPRPPQPMSAIFKVSVCCAKTGVAAAAVATVARWFSFRECGSRQAGSRWNHQRRRRQLS